MGDEILIRGGEDMDMQSLKEVLASPQGKKDEDRGTVVHHSLD